MSFSGSLSRDYVSAGLIGFYIIISSISAQASPKVLPDPKFEANWLLATCYGMEIPGNPQPDSISLAKCVQENGKSKLVTGFFYDGKGGTTSCRFGIDSCPNLRQDEVFARIEEEFECKNGKKNGEYKANIRHKNRSQSIFGARVEAAYVNGKLHGESRHYPLSKGYICFRYQYKNGLLDGKAEKLANSGKVIQEAHFRNGLKHGTQKSFSKNGVLTNIANYDAGFLNGESSFFDKQGNLRVSYVYEKGIEVKRTTVIDGVPVVTDRKALDDMRKKEQADFAASINSSQPKKPKLGKLFPFIGLNLGYLNDDVSASVTEKQGRTRVSGFTAGPQLILPFIDCQDIACSGYTINLGGAKSLINDSAFYHGEIGFGVMVFYISGYLGAGMRIDGDRRALQATFLGGVAVINLYIRGFAYTDKEGGQGFETGAMFTWPIYGF
jgi:hypothetical protein